MESTMWTYVPLYLWRYVYWCVCCSLFYCNIVVRVYNITLQLHEIRSSSLQLCWYVDWCSCFFFYFIGSFARSSASTNCSVWEKNPVKRSNCWFVRFYQEFVHWCLWLYVSTPSCPPELLDLLKRLILLLMFV